jgi:hypothetical protein
MQRRQGSLQIVVRFVLVSCAVVAAVAVRPAGAQATPAPIVELHGAPSPDCKNLGEVEGKYSNMPTRPEKAKESAFEDAAKLGATHVLEVPEKTGHMGTYTDVYTGIAYRCPVAAPPSQGK